MKIKIDFLVKAGIIAALYVVLVLVFNFSSFGPVQFRIAEALTILPYFTTAAIPGLFIGCLIANFIGGAIIWDVIFGSLATLLAAYLSHLLKGKQILVPLPPVLVNTVVVGLILKFAYGFDDALLVLMGGVFMGQMVSVYGFGLVLLNALKPFKQIF